MRLLSDPAIEAILKEWCQINFYNPYYTKLDPWIQSVETLCATYGIPDIQRAQCAAQFTSSVAQTAVEKELEDARAANAHIHWAQFVNFMKAYDRLFIQPPPVDELSGSALGIAGCMLLMPGAATGSATETIGLALRKRTAEEPPSLLQNSGVSANAEVLFDYCRDGHDECVLEDEDLSQLTPSAVRAIVKSWDILPYSPSMTDVESWLDAVHKFCEEYEVPAVQRALCGIYKMEEGCREEASAGRCEEMMWDQFKTWLSKHDDEKKTNLGMSGNPQASCQ